MRSGIKHIILALAIAAVALSQTANVSTIGSVTKIDATAKTLALKTDAGAEVTITLLPNASYRRVAPGETNLQNAATITLGDVAVGDRVLARGQAAGQANLVVIMAQSDIAKKQAADRADWEKRGVAGRVTAVSADSLTVNARTLAGASTLTITLAPNTIVRRYAPDSVKFTEATPAKLVDIKIGDQVRVRGEKSGDGSKLAAEEIVAGTFHTMAAVVASVSPASGEIQVTDLDTKKKLTVKVNADSNMRKLAPQAARAITARLRPAQGKEIPGGANLDIQQMIDRGMAITLADLKAGDAVVVASTIGASPDRVTAITLVAGVEPILTRPGTQQMSLGSWNLDGGIGAP